MDKNRTNPKCEIVAPLKIQRVPGWRFVLMGGDVVKVNRDLLVVPVATFAKSEDLGPAHIYYLNEDGDVVRYAIMSCPCASVTLSNVLDRFEGSDEARAILIQMKTWAGDLPLSRDELGEGLDVLLSDLADDLPTVDTRPWAELAKAVPAPTWFADLDPFRAVVLATAEALPESRVWAQIGPWWAEHRED